MREVPSPVLLRMLRVAPFLLFLAVYVPTAGHGFIRDDYAWILQSRVVHAGDLVRVLHSDNGFYRPLVALTFTIDEWLFDLHPLPYGLTNVLLALLCAAVIARLARALRLPSGAAVLAAALWLLNFHGLGMAVLWISGRTSLLATLAAVLAATAVVRGRLAAAVAWLAAALFAKEEAVLLPLVLLAWLRFLRPVSPDGRAPLRLRAWAGWSLAALGGYLAARMTTHAMTPGDAPSFYQMSLAALPANVLEYADRAATVSAAVLLLALVTLGRARPFTDQRTRAIVWCGLVWLVVSFGPTILLPVRSDLYACLPSVGACLAAAAVCTRLWDASTAVRRQRAAVAGLVLLALASPVYYIRTIRWTSLAEFAAARLDELEAVTERLPDGSRLELLDDRSQRANLDSAFGSLLEDALELRTGRRFDVSVRER